MNEFALEHSSEADRQDYLLFTAMLSQASYPPQAFAKGAKGYLKKKSLEKRGKLLMHNKLDSDIQSKLDESRKAEFDNY